MSSSEFLNIKTEPKKIIGLMCKKNKRYLLIQFKGHGKYYISYDLIKEHYPELLTEFLFMHIQIIRDKSDIPHPFKKTKRKAR